MACLNYRGAFMASRAEEQNEDQYEDEADEDDDDDFIEKYKEEGAGEKRPKNKNLSNIIF